ncbi:hypothetical protein [Coprococcus comes]|uniref:hypothetical protein n=1 Tax=Coprococcus comes TaxID=410072 RepID=UPI001899A438|nr:hypothetical protein [Coprococcus comes]
MSAKKAANLFRIYCFMCRCGAAGYSVSMLSVKPELEQAFNQLCSDVVLHIRVIRGIKVYNDKRIEIEWNFADELVKYVEQVQKICS